MTRIIVHGVHDNKLFATTGAALPLHTFDMRATLSPALLTTKTILWLLPNLRCSPPPCSIFVILLEIAAEPETLDPSLAIAFDDGAGRDCACGRERGGQPLRMRDHPDLRAR